MSKDIKDYLHYYLGCEVFAGTHRCKLIGVEDGAIVTHSQKGRHIILLVNIKLVLRPLSDMTEGEAIQYAQCYCKMKIPEGCTVNINTMHESGSVHILIGNDNEGLSLFPGGPHGDRAEAFRYLLSQHFDLFNLIPEGLAIDKTKL